MHLAAQNPMYVDSVKVLPQNPVATDSIWLHVWWWSPYGTSFNTSSVTHAGNNHDVNVCYTVGMITIVTSGHDSVFVFQGPAGMHTVSWTITQNGNTQCDMVVTQNQQQVNVIATGTDEHSENTAIELIPTEESFQINESGLFAVYSSSGQLVYEQQVDAGQRIAVRAYAGQMYFATLTDSNGRVTTIKFVLQ